MEPVIGEDDFHTAVAFRAAHLEEVHRVVVHAHQCPQAGSLFRAHYVNVQGCTVGEAGGTQVEEVARAIVFQVRVEAQKARQVHQEHQVKVGRSPFATVQPPDRVCQVGIERRIFHLLMQGMCEKFGQEEGDGSLVRVIRQGLEQKGKAGFLHALEVQPRAEVRLVFEDGERLEEDAPQGAPLAAGELDEVGHTSLTFGEDVDDHRRVIIFNGAQHDAAGAFYHTFSLLLVSYFSKHEHPPLCAFSKIKHGETES